MNPQNSPIKSSTEKPRAKGFPKKTFEKICTRITPEGFKRGTEVMFNINLDSLLYRAYPDFDMKATYPSFSMREKYTVISVFQPDVTASGKHEVTLRNADGDCYGYVQSEHLMLYPIDGKLPQNIPQQLRSESENPQSNSN